MKALLCLLIVMSAVPAYAEGESNSALTDRRELIRLELLTRYRNEVRPVFRKKCFDCHNSQKRIAFYLLPFLGRRINPFVREVEKAQLRLDMAHDFPDFKAKGNQNPASLLQAIQGAIQTNAMPPRLYRDTHRAGIRDSEKQAILNWIAASQPLLAELAADEHPSNPSLPVSPACRAKVVFQNRCLGCHTAGSTMGGVGDISDLANVAARFIDLGHPEDSEIYKAIHSGRMPLGGSPLATDEQEAVLNWIQAGAIVQCTAPMRP